MSQLDKLIHPELKSSIVPFKLMAYLARKNWGIKFLNFTGRFSNGKKISGLHNEERYIPSNNGGPDIRVRIYKPLDMQEKLPCMLFNHGGGYIIGNPEMFNVWIKKFIDTRPCVVIAPDYRKSFEAPYPAAFNDCFDTLLWAKENAEDLQIYNDKLIVAGHSAGGGLTAAVSLKARDTGNVDISFQMPLYPMIDDRQNTQSAREMISVPAWNTQSNKKGWDSYLKDLRESNKETPVYAAAARNQNYDNLPPTITFVGDIDPFKDETLAYAEALQKAGVDTKFKLYKGCFHGFEVMVPKAGISKEAIKFTYDSYAEFYDKYL